MADTIDEQLDRIKGIAEDSKEHAQAIMSFVFFTFCLQIITLILVFMIYKIMPRNGAPSGGVKTVSSAPIMTMASPMPIQAMQYPPAPPPVISMPGPMPAMAPPMGRYDMQ
eukprot:Tamp_33809.p1 GENE.Tamp_33809~~Tamp_33809.p1  ORF type:complete len:111 (-),score=23.31 Tamp_33809:291-623(-)